jgi:hypothetical protein
MTTLPAVVRIIDLPTATTITGGELWEMIQTVGGVQISVQVPATAVMTTAFGALPTGGGTGQLLAKTSASNYVANWSGIASFVSVISTTGLATSGSATAIIIAVSTGGLGSTQLAANAVQRTNITALAIGSAQIDTSAILRANITAVAIGSTQLDVAAVQRTNITSFAVGSSQIDTASIGTAKMVAGALGMSLINTLSPSGVASTNDTTSFTNSYTRYMITFDNIVPATNTTFFQMQVATTGAAFISAASYVSMAMVNVSSVVVTDTATTSLLLTGIRSTTSMQTSTIYGLNGFVYLTNPSNAVFRKGIVGEVSYAGAGASVGTTTLAQAVVNGVFDGNSNAITGVNFLFNSGNIATGTIRIYGIA